MLHSALPAIVPASASFGERRLGHSTLSKPFALGIGLMTGQQQAPQRSPYPSPPMTGSSPPANFPSQINKSEHSPRQERLHNILEHTRHSYHSPAGNHSEPLPHIVAEESGKPHTVTMAVSSPIGRSPFMAQPSTHQQPQRKTKSHVGAACINCKKAHLACDVRRPCPRCVGLNKQDTCKDVQHKKRGRPRLRDERSHSFEVNRIGNVPSQCEPTSPLPSPTAAPYSYRANTHRVIKSQTGDSHSRLGRSISNYASRSPQSSQLTTYFDDRLVQGSYTVPSPELKALLTDELVIAWSTEQLREFLGYHDHEIRKCMKSLFDIVSPDDREKLYRLSREIQDEVRMRDATYRAPPSPTVYAAIQSTPMTEVMRACTQSRILQETLNLRLACGRKYRTVLRMQVVRTSVFFVIAELAPVVEIPTLSHFNASSPTQGGVPQVYGNNPSPISMHPMSSPLHQNFPTDTMPYSLHQPRRLLSPVGSRPRSVHSESTYPSLAQYANSSASNSISQSWARGSFPHNVIQQGQNFRRHSDQPLAPNNLTLPPLRSFGSLERPSSAEEYIKIEPVGNEPVPMLKRITVQDVLE